jgi:RNA polymerase sigma factor (TIGR02999 family)
MPAPRFALGGLGSGASAPQAESIELMTEQARQRVTAVLNSSARAEVPALEEELMTLVEEQLRRLAGGLPQGAAAGRAVPAHALVREAYARLVDPDRVEPRGKARFYLAAGRAIRRILVEGARAANAQGLATNKSGIALPQLAGEGSEGALGPAQILALDQALASLGAIDTQEERVFELRCFAGLDDAATATALELAPRSAARDWLHARSWVRRERARAAGADRLV